MIRNISTNSSLAVNPGSIGILIARIRLSDISLDKIKYQMYYHLVR